MTVFRLALAVLLPPLAVFLRRGIAPHFWLNILLTLMVWVPGVIHALWVQRRTPFRPSTRV